MMFHITVMKYEEMEGEYFEASWVQAKSKVELKSQVNSKSLQFQRLVVMHV